MYYDLFSDLSVKRLEIKKFDLLVKGWQSKNTFCMTTSAVAAAGFQTQNLISKKCSNLGNTAVLFWGMLL